MRKLIYILRIWLILPPVFLLILSSVTQAETFADTRADKNIRIGISWGGQAAVAETTPISITYGFNEAFAFGFQYGEGQKDRTVVIDESGGFCFFWVFCVTGDKRTFDVKSKTINRGGFIKFYPGNTFYAFIGYNERTFDAELVGKDKGDIEIYADLFGKTNVTTIGIGNEWVFNSGFYLGTAWIAPAKQTSSIVNYKVTKTVGLNAEELTEWEKDIQDYGESVNTAYSSHGLLILTVGFAF